MLLDTDILLEYLRGRDPRVQSCADAQLLREGALTISVVSVYEVVRGIKQRDPLRALALFQAQLTQFRTLPFEQPAAILAGRIHADLEKTGQGVGRIDPMIAATAILHNGMLVTGNSDHLLRIAKLGYPLQLENWRDEAMPRRGGQ